jgi:hypothetical protein
MEPKYPNVKVKLVGQDGNAFAILGSVCLVMRRAGLPATVIEEYTTAATSGDYDNLLQVTMRYVEVS